MIPLARSPLTKYARATAQIRQLRCKLGVLPAADGSALFEMGNTKVLAAVYGPREVQKRSQTQQDKCNINVEFSMVRVGPRRRCASSPKLLREKSVDPTLPAPKVQHS